LVGRPLPASRSGAIASGNAASPNGTFEQNEVYDPRTDRWETLAPMPTPRHGVAAVPIDDQIYVIAGADRQGYGAVRSLEVYTVPAGKSCL
jgi:N-acetylneuraminic acid mutarotase